MVPTSEAASGYPITTASGAARMPQAHIRNLRRRISSGVSDSGAEPFTRHLAGERRAQISSGEFSPGVELLAGAAHSQENFGRSRSARRFQLAFRPQPVLTVVAGFAAPVQIKCISAALIFSRIRRDSAVGGLLERMFGILHGLKSS